MPNLEEILNSIRSLRLANKGGLEPWDPQTEPMLEPGVLSGKIPHPAAQMIGAKYSEMPPNVQGVYDPVADQIYFSAATGFDPAVFIHEIRHAQQMREMGGPEKFNKQLQEELLKARMRDRDVYSTPGPEMDARAWENRARRRIEAERQARTKQLTTK